LRATVRDAIEHVHGVTAVELLARDSRPRPQAPAPPGQPRFLGGKNLLDADLEPVQATVRAGAEGSKVADTPHLTGDPEWDALELAETDPTKAPLKIVR
jgi:hypothetical protein